jgi:hypothetical protein
MKISRFGIFFAGVGSIVFLLAFIQDYLGMEAYFQFARENWTIMSPWWWPPLLVVAIYLGLYAKQKEE